MGISLEKISFEDEHQTKKVTQFESEQLAGAMKYLLMYFKSYWFIFKMRI